MIEEIVALDTAVGGAQRIQAGHQGEHGRLAHIVEQLVVETDGRSRTALAHRDFVGTALQFADAIDVELVAGHQDCTRVGAYGGPQASPDFSASKSNDEDPAALTFSTLVKSSDLSTLAEFVCLSGSNVTI